MYDIDVNFLKDRGLDQNSKNQPKKTRSRAPIQTKVPLFVGGALLLLLPLGALGYLSLLNSQKTETQAEIAKLEAEMKTLTEQKKSVQTLKEQLEKDKADREALVTVFDQIKPTSVVLAEISELAPKGIQIKSVEQTAAENSSSSAATAAPGGVPPVTYTIKGFGNNHNDVNDFLIVLKGSEFLNPDKTVLMTAEMIPSTLTAFSQAVLTAQKKKVELPEVASFVIKAQLTEKPASQLLEQLVNRGALGLVTRIKNLEQIGAIEKK